MAARVMTLYALEVTWLHLAPAQKSAGPTLPWGQQTPPSMGQGSLGMRLVEIHTELGTGSGRGGVETVRKGQPKLTLDF